MRKARRENAAFAARLIQAREYRGMSQRDLSREANVSPGHICTMENAYVSPNARILANLAHALGLTMDQLWKGTS